MSLMMTLTMTSPLYTDDDLNFERVIEVRIVDSRQRKGIKQKSFSVYVPKGTKDKDYPDTEKFKTELQKAVKKITK